MSPRRICFYVLYAAAAFAVLALLCFPGEKIAGSLSAEAGRIGLSFAPQSVRPAFPLGFTCSRPDIGLGRTFFVRPDDLRFRLPFSSLFVSPKTLEISGTWHQGVLNGALTGFPSPSTGAPSLDLSVSQALFEQVPYTTDSFSLKAAFVLDGKIETGAGNGRQTLKGRLVLSRVRCMMQNGPMREAGIETLGFSRIDIEFIHTGEKTLRVTCKAKGDWADMDLEGNIQTGNIQARNMADLKALGLDLKGYFRPAPEHAPDFAGIFPLASLFDNSSARGIPVRITGTVGSPRITP